MGEGAGGGTGTSSGAAVGERVGQTSAAVGACRRRTDRRREVGSSGRGVVRTVQGREDGEDIEYGTSSVGW